MIHFHLKSFNNIEPLGHTLIPSSRNFIQKILPVPLNKRAVTAGVTLLSNLIRGYLFNGECKAGPLFVTWQPTFRCNSACSFCSTHQLNQEHPENVTLKRCLEIADEIGKTGAWTAGFTGGEVLLWPHLIPVLKRLKENGIITYVVTNGQLLEQYAEELIASGVDYIIVSLDSDLPEEHNSWRNKPNLFQSALKGIQRLKSLRSQNRPLIKCTTVMHKANYKHLPRIIESLKKEVDVLSLQPIAIESGNSPHGPCDEDNTEFYFKAEDKESVSAVIESILNDNPEFKSTYFKLIPKFWFQKSWLIEHIKCWSPFLRLSILPDGKVHQCVAYSRFPSIGNINSQSIMELWNSESMKKQRQEVKKGNNNCICWTQATAFNALFYSLPFFPKK